MIEHTYLCSYLVNLFHNGAQLLAHVGVNQRIDMGSLLQKRGTTSTASLHVLEKIDIMVHIHHLDCRFPGMS